MSGKGHKKEAVSKVKGFANYSAFLNPAVCFINAYYQFKRFILQLFSDRVFELFPEHPNRLIYGKQKIVVFLKYRQMFILSHFKL